MGRRRSDLTEEKVKQVILIGALVVNAYLLYRFLKVVEMLEALAFHLSAGGPV